MHATMYHRHHTYHLTIRAIPNCQSINKSKHETVIWFGYAMLLNKSFSLPLSFLSLNCLCVFINVWIFFALIPILKSTSNRIFYGQTKHLVYWFFLPRKNCIEEDFSHLLENSIKFFVELKIPLQFFVEEKTSSILRIEWIWTRSTHMKIWFKQVKSLHRIRRNKNNKINR